MCDHPPLQPQIELGSAFGTVAQRTMHIGHRVIQNRTGIIMNN